MSVGATDVERRWRALVRRFPAWRMPIDLVFDPGSWQLLGADLVSLMLRNKNVVRAIDALEGASDDTLNALAGIASVNVARTGDLLKAVVLGYISLPFAFAALLSDAAPEALGAIITNHATSIVILLFGAIAFPIVYFCGHWRAKQIGWTIELFRAGALQPSSPSR